MAINGITENNINIPLLQNVNLPKIGKDFDTLKQALQNGNIANAQKAFAVVQQDINNLNINNRNNVANGRTRANGQNNPAVNAFKALGQTLQNNNLAGAQAAFAALEQGQGAQQTAGAGKNHNNNVPVQANNKAQRNNDLLGLIRNLVVVNNNRERNNVHNNNNANNNNGLKA